MSGYLLGCRAALVLLGGVSFSVAVSAQSPVREMHVQLAAGFSPVEGRLITAGETIIFIDDAQPQASFFTDRSQIEQIGAGEGQAVTIQFKKPIRDREGERVRLEFRTSPEDRDALRAWFNQAPAAASTADRSTSGQKPPFPTYEARRDKFLGGDSGHLVVMPDRLSFEANSSEASREWLFPDIREIKQKGPYRLEIQPFVGDKYNLELLGGGGMAPEDFKRLSGEIARARSKR